VQDLFEEILKRKEIREILGLEQRCSGESAHPDNARCTCAKEGRPTRSDQTTLGELKNRRVVIDMSEARQPRRDSEKNAP